MCRFFVAVVAVVVVADVRLYLTEEQLAGRGALRFKLPLADIDWYKIRSME